MSLNYVQPSSRYGISEINTVMENGFVTLTQNSDVTWLHFKRQL